MTGWIVAACLVPALAAFVFGGVVWVQARRLTRRLERMLEEALAGTFRESAYDEGQLSKLETKMARLLGKEAAAGRRTAAEQQRIKSLVSDISHQTKTPVANIKLYTELLEERLPDGGERDMAGQVRAQAEKLEFLIAALVKTSRLENGIVALSPTRQDAGALAETVCAQFAPAAAAKGVALENLVRGAHVAAFDPKWTLEAVGNLVDNAVKYTPPGGHVTVSVREYELFLCLSVQDDGPGVAEEEQPRLFERFYRSPGSAQAPGVGLGLYLAREIAGRQGGYIKVSSAPGKGACFSLFLPK